MNFFSTIRKWIIGCAVMVGTSRDMSEWIKRYREDERRVKEQVWSVTSFSGKVVLDVGIGESSAVLKNLGAKVIGVERDVAKIAEYGYLGIPVIVSDFLHFPFNMKIADLVVFYFTLHEIDPAQHMRVLTIARSVAYEVFVVEPSPEGCPAYRMYAELWKKAMHSIGEFEDYKDVGYWVSILQRSGFKVITVKSIEWTTEVPPCILKEVVDRDKMLWRKKGVSEEYVEKLDVFLKYALRNGMKWSDINVIYGRATNPNGG